MKIETFLFVDMAHRLRGSLFFMDSELPLLTTDKPDIAYAKYIEILYYSGMEYDI